MVISVCLIAFSLTYAIRFPLRQRNGSNGDCDTIEITVYDYYAKKGIDLKYSGDFPCINTGKAKRPTYFPIEVCFSFVSYILSNLCLLNISCISYSMGRLGGAVSLSH
jgi:hypothetical protein